MADNTPTPEEREQDERDRNVYRFEGFRYQLQAPSTWGPNEIVPQMVSLYAFPRTDTE